MIYISLPGWEEFSDTHNPYPTDDGQIVWIPMDLDSGLKTVILKHPEPVTLTDEEFEAELIKAMTTPLKDPDADRDKLPDA